MHGFLKIRAFICKIIPVNYFLNIIKSLNFIAVLSQVKSFLPQMKMANQELQNRPAEEIDIEHVSDDQDRFIEMVH